MYFISIIFCFLCYDLNIEDENMQKIFITSFSVKGIKSLDQLITLSFYKKTIKKEFDTQHYNMKGIYGSNGSGKSGIITSVNILKNILTDTSYLSNPIV